MYCPLSNSLRAHYGVHGRTVLSARLKYTTVMNNSDGKKQYKVAKPPIFRLDGNFHEWRKDVVNWVSTIRDAHANGWDKNMNTPYKLLGRIV